MYTTADRERERRSRSAEEKRLLTQNELVRDRIPHDGGRETDAGTTLSSGVYASRRDFGDVFQQLRFGDSWVAHEANIDVASNLHAVAHVLGDAADEEKEKRFLDVLVAVDFRSDAEEGNVGTTRVSHQCNRLATKRRE